MQRTGIWDWPDSKVKRNAKTVERQILRSYASLSITRQKMTARNHNLFPKGRSRAVPAEFKRYLDGSKNLGPLEREARLLALTAPRCLHCGASDAREMDHLIPRSRGGFDMPFNTVTSCAGCNRSRGRKDLMAWYREARAFPCLALLRHYLKLCHLFAEQAGFLGDNPDQAVMAGLPFDPRLLPTLYPAVELLIWDWRFPDQI